MTVRLSIQAGGIIILILFLYSCDLSLGVDEHNNKVEIPVADTEEDITAEAPAQTFRLWHKIHQYDLSTFDYFGSFFNNRLKFYFTRSPDLHIGPAGVNMMMLYFLDDHLVKIRYHLDSDITHHLLDSLGLGELITQYSKNKTVYATEKALKTLREFNAKKNMPDRFDVAWDRHVIESVYYVDPYPSNLYKFDTISANYVYVDQLKSYHRRLIEIENELRSRHALIQ